MARWWLILAALSITLVGCEYQHDGGERKPSERERSRSANPGRERGSFQRLSSLMNRTEDRRDNRRRGKDNLNKILQMNRKHKAPSDDMLNDNEGAIATNPKAAAENDSNSLTDKMKELRVEGPTYEAVNKLTYVPQVTGVFCNFERENASRVDMCMWQWNTTVSSHGLGFKVATAADVVRMNESTRGLKFSGPTADADGNVAGHFLYLPVDPTMENMVIKSPPFRGLSEFCKFEAKLHQSKMQNASIRLISESTMSEVQWILQEVAGNNYENWHPLRFIIGKMQQEVRIIVEVTRPNYVSLAHSLPHIAIDNVRMVECLPEPPVFNGECQNRQLKCKILNKESCIKLQQVCDLVKDCDDGNDENQNCDKMPSGSYCNFEADACGFINIPQPILKWSRHSGPTPTDKTGPNFDHTCGPPDPYAAAPPLAPPRPLCVGYYFFVNMNVTGPNKERADFASTAVMRTALFNPPPRLHGELGSKYYNCCMIRFYYQQNGRNYGSLSVDVVEVTTRGNITTSLWFSTKDKGENWYRAAIFLPNITRRYYLQFKTRMGMRIYSDSAIDDFSMAPECFGLNMDPQELGDYNYYDPSLEERTDPHPDFEEAEYYRFTTCGAVGRQGPNQTMCDAAYNNTKTSVTVLQHAPFQGIQVWEVPSEGIYTIIATGGSGGLGSAWAGVSHAAQSRGLFELHKGEKIYMLVGQAGLNACKKTLSAQEAQECSKKPSNETLQIFTSKTHEVRNTQVHDGGGGGGGATYVFLIDKEGQSFPLMVAGGGGGLSVGVFRDDGSQHARGRTNATPESGYMYGPPGRTSGAGGGWMSRVGPSTPGHELVRGAALLEGGLGGKACSGDADGGFGGGGGGCLRGGGGGGWLGGNTNEGEGQHGGGGWSYADLSRGLPGFVHVSSAPRTGNGEVLVVPAVHKCGCAYRCVALNEYRSEVSCYCPSSWITDLSDPTKCIQENWVGGWVAMSLAIIIVSIASMVVVCFCLHLYGRFQRKKEDEVNQKRLMEQEVQLHRLRNPPGGNDNSLNMAFNPHYGSESILPRGVDVRGLPKVSRESLKLVKALGQGAFGEVYQGLYRHRTGDTAEMPVAVKTLPELSTGQAESDFLMEAAIMAKFNHPNVVHLIGVCFDRHPRFIVLELLAGGDLKNFLRESRPKPERASALTMKDLILCSLDVCKGSRYLEGLRFIHRDIAARNCLLTSRGPGRVVKIADFGMARDVYRAEYYKKGGKAMLPIKWMPPEAYIDGVFTIKTDVWSFGVLLWEVFSLGMMPYTGCTNREVMEMVSGGGRLEKPYGCPQEIYRLMCECWNPTPVERPSFAQMFDRLQRFLQDPEIVSAPLPVLRSLLPPSAEVHVEDTSSQRAAAGDYLVPKSPLDAPRDSSTDQVNPHSKEPPATPDQRDVVAEVSPYLPLVKASQDYGNIPMVSRGARRADVSATSSGEIRTTTKFLPSNSTDRLLSSVEASAEDSASEGDENERGPVEWETSFSTEPAAKKATAAAEPQRTIDAGPAVDKLISITPTSPKPPENALSQAIEGGTNRSEKKLESPPLERDKEKQKEPKPADVKDEIKSVKSSPETSQKPKETKMPSKPKPLCLDAALLEHNLNTLKRNSGSVNLATMNILPPYINVVTPSKLSESRPIQIDPKRAVIHGISEPQPESAGGLINGPLTELPYADSDSNGSGSHNGLRRKHYEVIGNGKKPPRRASGELADSEISC